MSFFKDKVHEEMDFITAAIQPMSWSLAEMYAQVPEEIDITADMVGTFNSISVLITRVFDDMGVDHFSADTSFYREVFNKDRFRFEVEEGTIIDGETGEFKSGSIKLLKNNLALEDEEMLNIFNNCIGKMSLWRNNNITAKTDVGDAISRVKDIIEIFNGKLETKSKQRAFKQARDLFIQQDFNIRDLDLRMKLFNWCRSYIIWGCAMSLANITKLKCMTHSGNPIYSMEEIK